METKELLYGLIGFFIGGLLVSIAATTFERGEPQGGMSMSQMSESLKNVSGDEFDKQYIDHMIEHHEGAIGMARLAESRAKHQEIKDLSIAIISAQDNEINDMKTWREQWGYGVGDQRDGHTGH